MTLFEQAGGYVGVRAIADVLYDRILRDPVLAQTFDGVDLRRLRGHQAEFLSWLLGGAEEYAGPPLGRVHEGLGISAEAFTRFVEITRSVLSDLQLDVDTLSGIQALLESRRDQIVGEGDQG